MNKKTVNTLLDISFIIHKAVDTYMHTMHNIYIVQHEQKKIGFSLIFPYPMTLKIDVGS